MAKIVAKALVRNSKGLYLVLYRGNIHIRCFPGILIFPAERLNQKKHRKQQ